jgi:hypothetical protein
MSRAGGVITIYDGRYAEFLFIAVIHKLLEWKPSGALCLPDEMLIVSDGMK